MESYEQAVDLPLMVVNLDKSIYKTMIRDGLKNFLNSQFHYIEKLNNQHETNKFILASKILLNDLQSIPVLSCSGRNIMYNQSCDKNVNYKTPSFEDALINPNNVSDKNITQYLFNFNMNTFNPNVSRMSQPLDTIKLYNENPNIKSNNLNSPNSHPLHDSKNTTYNQYSEFNNLS